MPRSGNTKPCGIEQTIPRTSGGFDVVYLPLEQLDVYADIVDVSATVTLTQTFWQYSPEPTSQAKYVFPVPARAAVCGFEMRTEDGRAITAVAKEKEIARKEHEQAVRRGRLTGLVEHVKDDVFTISLGSLPQLQMITTKLTYVLDLMDGEQTDQVRLQLPVCIGQRYGYLPAGMASAKTIPPERIKISSDIYMRGAIQSITSPSHPTVSVVNGSTLGINADVRGRTVRYNSPRFLSLDFVLSIKAEGLNAARCFAERSLDGTVALQLTVAPQVKLPPIPSQEYIFLVDRSGSMIGDRIATARRALVMLLRALPRKGSSFNIFSFGSSCNSLWKESMAYNEATLGEATTHVDSMLADYGGTEIRSALEKVFRSRCEQLPTSCFLLTDGEAYDTAGTIAATKRAADKATPEAPVRVFTLGIGSTTSTEMCEGISRASGGACLMALTTESIVGKCSKLVKASRTEILRDVTIDWGVRSDADGANFALRQGPQVTPSIYGGIRYVVFALINDPEYVVPTDIVVKTTCVGTGETLEFSVPVEELHGASTEPQRPMIHTLAARRIIMDLEDQERNSISDATKSVIIYLGERYQLASKFTSFIAVEDESQKKTDFEPEAKGKEAEARMPEKAKVKESTHKGDEPAHVVSVAPGVQEQGRTEGSAAATGGSFKGLKKRLSVFPAARDKLKSALGIGQTRTSRITVARSSANSGPSTGGSVFQPSAPHSPPVIPPPQIVHGMPVAPAYQPVMYEVQSEENVRGHATARRRSASPTSDRIYPPIERTATRSRSPPVIVRGYRRSRSPDVVEGEPHARRSPRRGSSSRSWRSPSRSVTPPCPGVHYAHSDRSPSRSPPRVVRDMSSYRSWSGSRSSRSRGSGPPQPVIIQQPTALPPQTVAYASRRSRSRSPPLIMRSERSRRSRSRSFTPPILVPLGRRSRSRSTSITRSRSRSRSPTVYSRRSRSRSRSPALIIRSQPISRSPARVMTVHRTYSRSRSRSPVVITSRRSRSRSPSFVEQDSPRRSRRTASPAIVQMSHMSQSKSRPTIIASRRSRSRSPPIVLASRRSRSRSPTRIVAPPTYVPGAHGSPVIIPATSPMPIIIQPLARRSRSRSSPARFVQLPSRSPSPSRPAEDNITQLVRLQSFDGAFLVTDALVALLGKDAIDEATKADVDQTVWATVLAIAYLQKHLTDEPELLESLVEKAREYVEEAGLPRSEFDQLLNRAAVFIA